MNNEMTTDNMSNEEVIEVLKGIVFNSFDRTTPKERQALHLAIKSLAERPTMNGVFMASPTEVIKVGEPLSNSDEISTALEKGEIYKRGFENARKRYERPTGEWVKVKEDRMSIDMSGEIATRYKCSKCGRMIATFPSKLADYPFCHCGAKMRKGEKE